MRRLLVCAALGGCININTTGGNPAPGPSGSGNPGSDSSSNSNSPGDAGLGSATTTGAIGIVVDSMSTAASIDGVGSSLTYYVIVAVTLSNSGPTPLAASDALFSLTTDRALDYNASGVQPQGACDASVMIAHGGQLQCSIAFAIPLAERPAALHYDDHAGDVATVTLPMLAAGDPSCETLRGWNASPSIDCLNCEQSSCGAEANAYSAQCTACSNACDNTGDACTCEAGCDTAACQSLFDSYAACVVGACRPKCT